MVLMDFRNIRGELLHDYGVVHGTEKLSNDFDGDSNYETDNDSSVSE